MSRPLKEEIDNLRTRRKGTVGVIGLSSKEVAHLTQIIIHLANNEFHLNDDQSIPDIMAVGINMSSKKGYDEEGLVDQAHLCYDYGCDIIAALGDGCDKEKDFLYYTKQGLEIPVLGVESGKGLEDLARKVLDHAIRMDPEEIRRPSTNYTSPGEEALSTAEELTKLDYTDSLDEALRCVMERNIKFEAVNQGIFMETRAHNGGYPLLETSAQNGGLIAIYGGAGPGASAAFGTKLANKDADFIHFSMNGAPGKLRYEKGGPSYVPHYLNTTGFIGRLIQMTPTLEVTAATPCNTAHKRLPEFLGDTAPHLDIREAVLKELSSKSIDGAPARAIILGTPTTTGVGSPEDGLYQQYIDSHDIDLKLITPSPEQQERITEAIYHIKSGNIEEAREIIISVITQIREAHGDDNLQVILGCTELPNAFLEAKLSIRTPPEEESRDEIRRSMSVTSIESEDIIRRMSVSSSGDLEDYIPLEKGLIDPTTYLADKAAQKEMERLKELGHRHNIKPTREEQKLSEEEKYLEGHKTASKDLAYLEEEERMKKEESDSPVNSPGVSPQNPGRTNVPGRRLITEKPGFRR